MKRATFNLGLKEFGNSEKDFTQLLKEKFVTRPDNVGHLLKVIYLIYRDKFQARCPKNL